MLFPPPGSREPDCDNGEERRKNVDVEHGTCVSGAQIFLFHELLHVSNSGAKVENRAGDARAQRVARP
jgi:hypothetical protein